MCVLIEGYGREIGREGERSRELLPNSIRCTFGNAVVVYSSHGLDYTWVPTTCV